MYALKGLIVTLSNIFFTTLSDLILQWWFTKVKTPHSHDAAENQRPHLPRSPPEPDSKRHTMIWCLIVIFGCFNSANASLTPSSYSITKMSDLRSDAPAFEPPKQVDAPEPEDISSIFDDREEDSLISHGHNRRRISIDPDGVTVDNRRHFSAASIDGSSRKGINERTEIKNLLRETFIEIHQEGTHLPNGHTRPLADSAPSSQHNQHRSNPQSRTVSSLTPPQPPALAD